MNTTIHNTTSTLPPFGHGLERHFAQAIGFTFLCIIVVAVVCNIVLIAAIVSIRTLHSVLHLFIVNMAVSDLITGIYCVF